MAVGLLALAGTSALSLTACTVPLAGSTGISVDFDGNPVLVFALCEAHIDGATIYRDRTKADPVGDDSSVSAGSWESTSPITPVKAQRVELNTFVPSRSWTPIESREDLRPGVRYSAYGWTHDNSWSAGNVAFTVENIARLRPGQVFFQRYDEKHDNFVDAVQTYAQFRADACDDAS